MSLQYYHHPQCSKSRAALALLQQAGFEPVCVHYLEQPPTVDSILDVARKVGVTVRQLVRDNEEAFAEYAHIAVDDDGAWAAAIAATPQLLQRPILVTEQAALVCRPPESAVTWLIEQGHERT